MPGTSVVSERRRLERHGSAALRAVSGRPTAELRGHRLRVDGHIVSFATPYLTLDLHTADDEPDIGRSRGINDALGLLLRSSDLSLHLELSPDDLLEHIVFDVLEQLRCDALVPTGLRGVRANADAAFDAWCLDARASRVSENRIAMLVYTVTHMVRARLMGKTLPEDVDELIEATRGQLGTVIGHALRELSRLVDDQRAYAEPALEIARLVTEVAGDATESLVNNVATRHRLLVPSEWLSDPDTPEDVVAMGAAGTATSDGAVSFASIGDYHIYTTDYDREVRGTSLFRPDKLRRLRASLDETEHAQAISTPRLAQRLLRLFGAPTDDDWRFGHDQGVLDGRRLGQLVANPSNHELFKDRRQQQIANTAVTFLIDNSGSMKRQRFQAVAVLVDTFSRALDLAGVTNEILGFTTGGWSGGRPIGDWNRAGQPERPGRMNETLHIVYKDADVSWRRARSGIASLSDPQHFREGVDGEALAWAHQRLISRNEPRRIIVMISDGSPTDAATSNVNRAGFLDDHLAQVAALIEQHNPIELGAIGIDLDMAAYIRNSIELDLTGTLTLQHYSALEMLFGHSTHR